MNNDFSQQITLAMSKYSKICSDSVEKVIDDVAAECVMKLKETSPRRHVKGGGKYARGWHTKKEKRQNYVVVRVQNKKAQLTHLLENGHYTRAKVNRRFVPAQVHIKPVEDWANAEIVRRIAEVLEE